MKGARKFSLKLQNDAPSAQFLDAAMKGARKFSLKRTAERVHVLWVGPAAMKGARKFSLKLVWGT